VTSFQGQRGLTNNERFDAMFKVSETGCWEWQGSLDKDGYGLFWDGEKQKNARAHRFAYERLHGPLGNLQACHRCDNPACVRPEHLFEGTNKDNMDDKAEKGRTLGFAAMKGEQHTQAKLTEVDVSQIKRRLASGDKQKEIARDYGIDATVISRIKTRKIWKDVHF